MSQFQVELASIQRGVASKADRTEYTWAITGTVDPASIQKGGASKADWIK
jgi:hypothetical protein